MNEGAQDGNGNGSWSGDGAGTGTGTGVETRRRTPDGNGNGNGDGSEDSSGDGNGDEDNGNGNEDRIGEGGREAKRRKKPQNSCRRHVENGGDLGGKRKKCRKERANHLGGREGSACGSLPFLWGANLRVPCVALVGLYGRLVRRFGLGLVAWTEPRLLGTAAGQQAWWSERAELKAGLLLAERCGLVTSHLDSLTPPSRTRVRISPRFLFCPDLR